MIRKTKNYSIVSNVRDEIESWIASGFVILKELTKKRIWLASDIAMEFGLKGADAIRVALAKELKIKFLTLDEEVKEKVRNKVGLLEI